MLRTATRVAAKTSEMSLHDAAATPSGQYLWLQGHGFPIQGLISTVYCGWHPPFVACTTHLVPACHLAKHRMASHASHAHSWPCMHTTGCSLYQGGPVAPCEAQQSNPSTASGPVLASGCSKLTAACRLQRVRAWRQKQQRRQRRGGCTRRSHAASTVCLQQPHHLR